MALTGSRDGRRRSGLCDSSPISTICPGGKAHPISSRVVETCNPLGDPGINARMPYGDYEPRVQIDVNMPVVARWIQNKKVPLAGACSDN